MARKTPSIAIIGAGIIGLSCAWELVRRGARVNIYEKCWPPRGASWAAAGMLAPAYEVARSEAGVHPRLLELCMASAELWPKFADELEAASGVDIGYRTEPALAIASDLDQTKGLADLRAALDKQDIPYTDVPVTLGGLPAALEAVQLPTDRQVDNRALIMALASVVPSPEAENSSHFAKNYDVILQTNGWVNGHCRAVKGQLLSVSQTSPRLTQVIHSGDLYIVPKADRIVIGATSEPDVVDTETDADVIDALFRRAVDICPPLSSSRRLEAFAGIRPVSEDHAPVLVARHDRAAAVGHGRNGILLAPITARLMADMILEGRTSELAAAFGPERFTPATA